MQNFVSNLMPNKSEGSADGTPWYMKYAGKVLGVVAGSLNIILGPVCAVGITPMCIVAGIFMMVAGLVVIVVEAPFCCAFLEFAQQISGFMEGRPVWQKAALYLVY